MGKTNKSESNQSEPLVTYALVLRTTAEATSKLAKQIRKNASTEIIYQKVSAGRLMIVPED